MATRPAPQPVEPNDWQAVEPTDWQTVGASASSATPPAPQKEGFLGELGKQNVAMGKGLAGIVTGPFVPAQEGAKGLLHGLYETAAAPLRELAGRPQPGQSVITAPHTPLERVGGAVDAAIGGDPAAARAHVASGDQGAAVADLIGIPAETFLAGSLLKKFLPKRLPSNAKAANLLTKAAGATEGKAIEFPKEFSVALPELNKTPPKVPFDKMTVRDLNTHVQDTFGVLEKDFNNKFSTIARDQVMPDAVAKEIRSYKILNPILPEDLEWNNKLETRAVLFEQPHNYGDLNIQRMRARDRIGDFQKQFPSTQGSKMGSNVNIVLDTAIHDSTKNLVYDALEQKYAGQVAPNYFRDLKRTESALYNIKDQLGGRTKQLANQDAKTFLDNLRVHEYMSSGGHVGMAAGGIMPALFPESSVANKAVRKALAPRTNKYAVAAGTAAPVVSRRAQPSLAPGRPNLFPAPQTNATDDWANQKP